MGTPESKEAVLRWRVSNIAPIVSVSTGQDPALLWLTLEETSGPTAPCSNVSEAACSDSNVGEDGGEGRDFRFVDAPDRSFRKPFFSFFSLLSFSSLHGAVAVGGAAAGPAGVTQVATPNCSPSRAVALTLGGVMAEAAEVSTTPILAAVGAVTTVKGGMVCRPCCVCCKETV